MTEHEQILDAVGQLRDEVKELRQVITGDKIRKIPGMVDILDTHRRELYGDKETQHVGLKESQEATHRRLQSLEGDRGKIMFAASVASSIVALGWMLIKFFFLKP